MSDSYEEYIIAKADKKEQFRYLSSDRELKYCQYPRHAHKFTKNDALARLFNLRETQKDDHVVLELATKVLEVKVTVSV